MNSSNINFDSFIKDDFIKSKFIKSCTVISTEDDLYPVINDIISGNVDYCLVFNKDYLKQNFIDILTYFKGRVSIFNANSNFELFIKNFINRCDLIIYTNVRNCINENIIEYIKNYKGIMIG